VDEGHYQNSARYVQVDLFFVMLKVPTTSVAIQAGPSLFAALLVLRFIATLAQNKKPSYGKL